MIDFIFPSVLCLFGFYGCVFSEEFSRRYRTMAAVFMIIGAVNIGRELILHGIK